MTGTRKTPSLKQQGESGIPASYATAFAEIQERVRTAQYAVLKSVDKQLVGLYWDIGRIIVERQAAEGWGRSVVETLAGDLQRKFPGVNGFSAQNLWYMRQFFEEYHGNEKLQPLVGEIAWTHNLVIMSKYKDPLEREFYLRMTRKFGWSKNVLIHQIENQSYEEDPAAGKKEEDQSLKRRSGNSSRPEKEVRPNNGFGLA
jgi:predicted nuclease of restriction endonuclease-like (RecB) superfamily